MIRTLYDSTDPLRDEMHLHDIPGQFVLKAVGEPGFDNLADLFPRMRETRTVLGLKGYPVAIGLDWDGTLNRGGIGFLDGRPDKQIGPRDILFFCVGEPPRPVREFGWENTRRSLERGLPIVTTQVACSPLTYRQTAFACSEGMSSEKDLAVMVRWQLENPTGKRRRYRVRLCSNPGEPEILKDVSGTVPPGKTRTHCWKILYRNSGQRRELTTLLGYPYTGELFGRWNISAEVSQIPPEELDSDLRSCREFWNNLLSGGMQVVTPETRVNDAFRAWQVYNRINTRGMKVRGNPAALPHDGSGFYGDVYAITALTMVHSLVLTGHFREAFQILRDLLFYQKDNGLFFQKYGLCDNGGFLFVIAQYYLVSGDRKGFEELLPHARRAIRWLRGNRTGDHPLVSGLLRKGQYTADIPQEDYCYMNDAYNWRGIAEMALALERAGLRAEASRLAREAREYRGAILASMKESCFPERDLAAPGQRIHEGSFLWRHRAIVRRSDLTVVPMTPVSRELERRFLGGYYYSFALGHLLETEILDPEDALCRSAVTYAGSRGGILLGLQRWCEYAGIDHAYSYGYLMTKIRKGDIPGVLLGFYAILAYGMDRDTFAGTEVVDLVEGNPHYGGKFHYQPHTLSSSMQVRLLRMMLVREEDRILHLASATPRPWHTRLVVADAPTIWGPVSFTIQEKNRSMEARLAFLPHGGDLPEEILVRIRDPRRRFMASVTVNGRTWKNFSAGQELVRLPGTISTADISVGYR